MEKIPISAIISKELWIKIKTKAMMDGKKTPAALEEAIAMYCDKKSMEVCGLRLTDKPSRNYGRQD